MFKRGYFRLLSNSMSRREKYQSTQSSQLSSAECLAILFRFSAADSPTQSSFSECRWLSAAVLPDRRHRPRSWRQSCLRAFQAKKKEKSMRGSLLSKDQMQNNLALSGLDFLKLIFASLFCRILVHIFSSRGARWRKLWLRQRSMNDCPTVHFLNLGADRRQPLATCMDESEGTSSIHPPPRLQTKANSSLWGPWACL